MEADGAFPPPFFFFCEIVRGMRKSADRQPPVPPQEDPPFPPSREWEGPGRLSSSFFFPVPFPPCQQEGDGRQEVLSGLPFFPLPPLFKTGLSPLLVTAGWCGWATARPRLQMRASPPSLPARKRSETPTFFFPPGAEKERANVYFT